MNDQNSTGVSNAVVACGVVGVLGGLAAAAALMSHAGAPSHAGVFGAMKSTSTSVEADRLESLFHEADWKLGKAFTAMLECGVRVGGHATSSIGDGTHRFQYKQASDALRDAQNAMSQLCAAASDFSHPL